MLQNGIKIIEISSSEKNSAQIYYSHLSRVTLDDFMNHFHHRLQEHLTDTRLVLLESALPRYYESEAPKQINAAGLWTDSKIIEWQCGKDDIMWYLAN